MSKHLAPNGKPSNLTHEQWHLVRTPEFKAWFGDWENDPKNASKVVDENGEPLVCYHGSPKRFNKFKERYNRQFFTNSKGHAEIYGDILYECFLSIKRPSNKAYPNETLIENNKDGFINNYGEKNFFKEKERVYFTLRSKQIKLADGSNTTFDANNPDIRFEQGGLIAPNGKPSNLTPEQYKLVRTPEFKAFFGDWENDPKNASKVVDENGEPLVVYHATDKWELNGAFKNIRRDIHGAKHRDELGIHFGNKEQANQILELWSGKKSTIGKYIKPFFLNVRNLKRVKDRNTWDFRVFEKHYEDLGLSHSKKFESIDEVYEDLKNQKIDGLIYYNEYEGEGDSYLVFDSTQIKLADGSNITFNGADPDIRFEGGGLIAPNGRKSNLTPEQYKLVRTPQFKAWFGDWQNDPANASKVLDENGEPLVVHHGTKYDFNTFRGDKLIWTTPEIGYIDKMKGMLESNRVIDLFANSRKILDLTQYGYKYYDQKTAYNIFLGYGIKLSGILTQKFGSIFYSYLQNHTEELKDQMMKLGYDGIKVKVHRNYDFSFGFLQPNQIKLADGTNTKFDGNNPDIRYAQGGGIKYEKGGQVKHTFGKYGGYLVGNRHSEGGIKATNKSTGQPLEMEGGEVVITRNAVSDNQKREFEGEMLTNKEILSRINQSGGGVSFADGGEVKSCRCHGKSYKYGGKTMTDFEIVRMMAKQHPDDFKKGVKEELSEHKETFLDLKKAKISITEAAKLVVAEHLQKKPDYYTNYGSGGYITYDQKVIPSLDKFVSKNLGVFMKVDGHLSMYLPITQSGTDIVEYFMDGMTHKPKISRVAAYKKYLLDMFGIDFKKLSVKVKNALLLGKQTFISSN